LVDRRCARGRAGSSIGVGRGRSPPVDPVGQHCRALTRDGAHRQTEGSQLCRAGLFKEKWDHQHPGPEDQWKRKEQAVVVASPPGDSTNIVTPTGIVTTSEAPVATTRIISAR
jgi:hypothetical protein